MIKLVEGKTYAWGESCNLFTVLSVHEQDMWIKWLDGGETEIIHIPSILGDGVKIWEAIKRANNEHIRKS